MAEALLVGAVVGGVLGKAIDILYEELKALIVKNLAYASLLEEIICRLDSLKPLIQQMTEVYSEEELQGLVKVIQEGKALVGGYLVYGKNPKKKDVDNFNEWDGRLKRQLEMLDILSLIDGRKTAVNTAEILPLVRDAKAIAQNTEVAVQQLQLDGRKAVDNTEEMVPLVRETNSMVQQLLNRSSDTEKQNLSAENEAYCAVPELPPLTVGLDGPIKELKRMMFEDKKSMIVVNAMGGSGKTTLAINFCRDPQVEERFKNNIFFVTVSKKFNLELILQQLHQRKGLPVPALTSQENAVTWLHRFLKKEEHNPLLLVLDDVWPESESFLGKFLSEEMNYKILVTSRSQLLRFASQDSQYKLESLNGIDAMKLFNHSTNGSPDLELSEKIIQSCKGLPLGLTVVGGSLSGQPIDIWRKRIIESSKGRPVSTPEDELYDCLQRSLDALNENMKEYFLDLGAFPDHKRISVGALIDMWAELYDLTLDRDGLINEEEDTLCNAELINLKNRNLANLVDTRKDKIEEDGYRKGDYVTLHDLLKELAIQNSALVPEEQRTRLIVDIRGNVIPKWWRKQKDLQARLLSVSTDGVFSKKLPKVTLTEAEVLILNFRTKIYILPEFVENMPELKVLLVKYDGRSHAELDNFKQLGSLPNLKRITLESLSMHSIMENPFRLKSLLKMSLILCDLTPSFSNGCVKISDAFPKLEELIIDGCSYCEEFLTKCCDLVQLTKLSIINCRGLQFLPERMGSLVNLEVLRLRSCKDLLELPDSVAKLKRVKFLDISECSSIGKLPISMGEMSSLTKLDLRYCQDTDELRESVSCLKQQLKEVICTCTYSTKQLWEAVEPSLGRIITLVKDPDPDGKYFSSGLESANFVLTSDPVHQAWNAIEKQKQINPNAEPCFFNEIQAENPTIVAFGTPPSSLQGQEALVSSSNLKEDNFAHFEFLCNKRNPTFSLNQAAIKLFKSHYPELLQLKKKLVENSKSKTPSLVIITGQSVGGSVATLFTLWLLEDLNLSKTKRPLCITFGSPLVGDENLRRCVLQFSTWKSCFLHIVSNQDPTPQHSVSLNPGACKPFGTFLLCSASGCACFEDPDIILEQFAKNISQNEDCHYGTILGYPKYKALCNVSNVTEADTDSLSASLIIELQAIGILSQQQPSQEIDSLIVKMKKHETKLLIQKKKNSDSDKKLNEMKVYMAFLEWYKKESRQHEIGGYYDRYRNQGNISDVSVNAYKKKLMNYWEDSVTEVENKPQMEGAHFRVRWLWAGTNYRRMVEPLHIADYYRDGGKNYRTEGKRPKHFVLLEERIKEVVKPEATPSKSKKELVGSSLNEDSCFWAEVEEARISCNLVKDGLTEKKERALQELKKFEADVYASLKNYALSPDIFLEKSSFMQWFKEYKGVVEQPYSSLLLDFMNDRNYEAYEEGGSSFHDPKIEVYANKHYFYLERRFFFVVMLFVLGVSTVCFVYANKAQ